MSNLKSDQSVDIITVRSVPAPSEARLLEVSEVPRICITRSLNSRVGNTFARDMLGPSPIPAFPDPPRTKQCGGDDSAAERPARECAPTTLLRLSRPLIPRSYSTPASFTLVKSGLAGQTISYLTPLA